MLNSACRCLIVCMAVQVLGAGCLNLKISPQRSRIVKEANTTVTILCTADVPLTACQVSWWAEKESPGPVLELGPGSRARPKVDPEAGLLDYRYSGRGLAHGECGVTLRLMGKKVWTVGCRVQAGAGGWKYETMDLLAYSTDPLPGVTVDPTHVVVLPGKEVSIMCKAPEPVDACYISLPGKAGYLDFYKGLSSHDSVGRHIYRGSGRQSGECGLTWRDIGEADNGPVRCYLWKAPKFAENRGINIIVARAPKNPVLQVVYDGDTLRASCTVEGGRPVADIQWLLGDDVIRNDGLDDVMATPGDEWAWPWSVTSITQNLTRRMEAGDYGKVLKCVTSHVALDEPLEARQTLSKSGDEGPSGSGPGNKPRASYKSLPCSTGSTLLETICEERAGACPAREDSQLTAIRLATAQASLKAAQLAEEAGQVVLEAAKSSARAEDARARSEEARASEEEAWSKNAAEELEYEQERRSLGRKQLHKKTLGVSVLSQVLMSWENTVNKSHNLY